MVLSLHRLSDSVTFLAQCSQACSFDSIALSRKSLPLDKVKFTCCVREETTLLTITPLFLSIWPTPYYYYLYIIKKTIANSRPHGFVSSYHVFCFRYFPMNVIMLFLLLSTTNIIHMYVFRMWLTLYPNFRGELFDADEVVYTDIHGPVQLPEAVYDVMPPDAPGKQDQIRFSFMKTGSFSPLHCC